MWHNDAVETFKRHAENQHVTYINCGVDSKVEISTIPELIWRHVNVVYCVQVAA